MEITGVFYAVWDAAHARMIAALDRDDELPFEVRGQIIYHVGPTLARPGEVIGSAGPTTSGRMDAYTPRLIELGLKGMIGKGYRNAAIREALGRYRAVNFAAIGGAEALPARRITASELVAYENLGPEAIRRLTVERFPVMVVNLPVAAGCQQPHRQRDQGRPDEDAEGRADQPDPPGSGRRHCPGGRPPNGDLAQDGKEGDPECEERQATQGAQVEDAPEDLVALIHELIGEPAPVRSRQIGEAEGGGEEGGQRVERQAAEAGIGAQHGGQ